MQILTFEDRQKIERYLAFKFKKREIGRRLGRDPRVIRRELASNTPSGKPYTAASAQARARKLASKTNCRKLEADRDLHDYVLAKLRQGFSPEEIAGRLKHSPPVKLQGHYVNHESIYQYIYEGEGRWEGLFHLLRRKQPKRRKQCGRKAQKVLIPQRISIHERPEVINARQRFGDWETDTIQFTKQKGGVSVQYERKAMLARIHKLASRTSEETESAIRQTAESIVPEFFKSLTWDNGGEGVCHIKIRDDYNIPTYFCDPYSSWQKGGVENLNGLLREYLPRSTDLSKLTEKQLYTIQERLNNRPRKKLNYLTPNEVYAQTINQRGGALNP